MAEGFTLLTVGDGDLSFSLSLKRAYPSIHVTASTLVESTTELYKLYNNAADISKEFTEVWNEDILYKVDATNLKGTINSNKKYDLILFNHPHLGDSTLLKSEALAAQRHYSLLSHYFYSAKEVLNENGRIHVCLSGNQPKTWNVIQAARNCGLQCVSQESTSCPISKWLFHHDDETSSHQLAEAKPHYKPPRKFRNGKLGSKHFLSRYGYRHRRTEGDLFQGDAKEMNVSESVNFVFAIEEKASNSIDNMEAENTCHVCHMRFNNKKDLCAHLESPALPDVAHRSSCKEGKCRADVKSSSQSNVSKIVERNLTTTSIDINDATILIEATVEQKFDSKRIKWLCRQEDFPLSKYIKSKSQCQDAIKNGRIFLNRQVVLDTGRFVRENDVISLVKDSASTAVKGKDDNSDEGSKSSSAVISFVREIESHRKEGLSLVVANKPVGVRCVGSFSTTTLEMKTKKHYERSRHIETLFCRPLTKLDTGCGGLCAIAISPSLISEADLESSLNIRYNFTVLVHGKTPETWKSGVYAKVPANGVRQWKRQKTVDNDVEVDNGSPITISAEALDLGNAVLIKSLEALSIPQAGDQDEQFISTLSISSGHDDGRLANVIAYILRKLGFPIVNDRFAKREYSCLPRRMKNILKQKVCIGCYSLTIEFEGATQLVTTESHKRTQCKFWRETLN